LWLFYCKWFSLLSLDHAEQPLVTPDDTRVLAHVVQTPTWKWVVDVYKSRGFSVDVVDEHLNVLPPLLHAGNPLAVDPVVIEAVRQLASALSGGHGETASLRGRHFRCMPIAAGGSLAGATLVGGDEEHSRDDELQHAAALLSRILEDFVSPADGQRTASRRLSALHDLLGEARNNGSELDVFRVFAEIMNVWDDAEVVGYRGDLSGHYVLAATLPGSDRTALPDVIAADAVPAGNVVTLPASTQRQLGFGDARFPILVRVPTTGGSWLIAMSHQPGVQQLPDWFDFYVAALGESLAAAFETELARSTSAIAQRLADNESPREALTRAVAALADTIGGVASFTMWEPDGTIALAIGEALRSSDSDVRRADVLRIRIDAPAGRHACVEMRPSSPGQFTRRDLNVFEAAAWTLSRWFSGAAEQLAAPREQPAMAQSFDEVVDRCVRAGKRSGSIGLILIMPGSPDTPTDLAYEWIRKLRSQLRPTDLAGRLTTGEIAIVAIETTAQGALIVARRIERMLNDSIDPLQTRVRVGLAARAGLSTSAHGLIAEARQHLVEP